MQAFPKVSERREFSPSARRPAVQGKTKRTFLEITHARAVSAVASIDGDALETKGEKGKIREASLYVP